METVFITSQQRESQQTSSVKGRKLVESVHVWSLNLWNELKFMYGPLKCILNHLKIALFEISRICFRPDSLNFA
jgi:hypothetical protein